MKNKNVFTFGPSSVEKSNVTDLFELLTAGERTVKQRRIDSIANGRSCANVIENAVANGNWRVYLGKKVIFMRRKRKRNQEKSRKKESP